MNYETFNQFMMEAKNERFWSDVVPEIEYSYFQEELYGIRKKGSKFPITFLHATSPQEAIRKYINDHKVINVKHLEYLKQGARG